RRRPSPGRERAAARAAARAAPLPRARSRDRPSSSGSAPRRRRQTDPPPWNGSRPRLVGVDADEWPRALDAVEVEERDVVGVLLLEGPLGASGERAGS